MSAPPTPAVAPLDFGTAPSSPSARSAAPAPAPVKGPAPLDFSHVRAKPAPAPAPVPVVKAPKVGGLDFSSVPAVPPAPAGRLSDRRSGPATPPTPVFAQAVSAEEQRAIAHAESQFADLFRQHGSSLRNTIQQLLPFNLSQLENFGRSALENQGRLVSEVSVITRDFRLMDANGLIREALSQAQGKGSLLDRLRGHKVNLNAFRVRAEALRVQIGQFLPRIEAVRQQLKDEGDRLPILMAALSSAASAVSTQRDAVIDMSVNNRRTILTQAVQQRQVLVPQIEEMRRQAVEQLGALDNFVQTTLPALELATAQG